MTVPKTTLFVPLRDLRGTITPLFWEFTDWREENRYRPPMRMVYRGFREAPTPKVDIQLF